MFPNLLKAAVFSTDIFVLSRIKGIRQVGNCDWKTFTEHVETQNTKRVPLCRQNCVSIRLVFEYVNEDLPLILQLFTIA